MVVKLIFNVKSMDGLSRCINWPVKSLLLKFLENVRSEMVNNSWTTLSNVQSKYRSEPFESGVGTRIKDNTCT